MPKVSVMILTKNRAELLQKAILSVQNQSFSDVEVIVVNDGSTDTTANLLKNLKIENLKILTHPQSLGITVSRQEALLTSLGEYVAILDDDDEWSDVDKLKKQAAFLDDHSETVLCGGGIRTELGIRNYELRMRPETDGKIRKTMLLRNNFFTSTVMFRREAAIRAGGFISAGVDLGEDYDLWLRLGKLGKFYNFQQVFTNYLQPSYNKAKYRAFLQKQLRLIVSHKAQYPHYQSARVILKVRLLLLFPKAQPLLSETTNT